MRSNDTYHCRILATNIKRWNKISNKYKISAEFKSEPFELTPEQVADIEHFLIETKYYPQYKWPHTNAPDFLTIYSRTDTLERTNQEWKCNSYLKLREKLSPSNIR